MNNIPEGKVVKIMDIFKEEKNAKQRGQLGIGININLEQKVGKRRKDNIAAGNGETVE